MDKTSSEDHGDLMLRWAHLALGLLGIFIFLAAGVVLHNGRVAFMDLTAQLFFRSRTVYLLAAALPPLMVGAVGKPLPPGAARHWRAAGLAAWLLCEGLLIAAFVVEPSREQVTSLSVLGIISLAAGAAAHAVSGWVDRHN